MEISLPQISTTQTSANIKGDGNDMVVVPPYQYYPKYFSNSIHNHLYNDSSWPINNNSYFDNLLSEINFTQGVVTVFGKKYNEPRLTAVFATSDLCDAKFTYTYSKSKREVTAMPKTVAAIHAAVVDKTQIKYNFVLVNLYRNGKDKIGWHADDEKEMDHSSVASVSFGATREFRVRCADAIVPTLPEPVQKINCAQDLSFQLGDGDLFIMGDGFQQKYLHCVPAQPKVTQPRINLTFRRAITANVTH